MTDGTLYSTGNLHPFFPSFAILASYLYLYSITGILTLTVIVLFTSVVTVEGICNSVGGGREADMRGRAGGVASPTDLAMHSRRD